MNSTKPQFDYLNFDLLIERAGSAYVARVTNSPAGEAASQFSVPFAPFELENFLLKIGRPRRGVRRLNSPEMEAAKNFGKRLFESVFGSEVFGCLRSSLDQAEAKGSAGLRLRLRLNAPELADLPWEYLYNSALNRFLVLAVETPLVRYIELPERIRPLAVQPPLKILAMLSAPTGYALLNVEEEWQKLQNALGDLQKRKLVTLERLDEATLPALQRRLRQSSYHIFHFIGHGGYDESAQDGVLLLEDETRHSRKVSGQFLGTILHNHRPLRLAVLNACEGARASRTDPFTGAAQSLVHQGLPAVIAMQFEITDAAAITFSHEFYTALADGYPVDAALVEARAAIFAGGNDVEWGTPVLYMRAPDGKIFDLASSVTPQPRLEETPPPNVAPSAQPHFDEVPALLQEAERACSTEDWQTAIEKYQFILKLRSDNAEAKAGLDLAQEEARLATLYAEGRAHQEAKRWSQALEKLRQVQKIRPQYKQVNELVAAIERSLAEQNRSEQVAALLQEAEKAAARKDWQTAIARLQRILELEPTHAEAQSILRSARQELDLAKLYEQGQAHLTAKQWQQAVQSFRRVQELRSHYEDAEALLASAEREWRKEQEALKPKVAAVPPPAAPKASRRGWILSGLALLIVVVSWQIYKNIDLGQSLEEEKPSPAFAIKSTSKYTLRSVGKSNLSTEAVKNMLKEQDFFCKTGYDWSNPQGRGMTNDFVLQASGKVVLDRATDLMWQQAGSPEYMTYEEAQAYVAQLNRDNFAGYANWRLPTLEEAMSLMEPSELNADLYIDAKFDKTQRYIWTADKESAGVAWVAYFDSGECFRNAVGYDNFVRAVRAGQ